MALKSERKIDADNDTWMTHPIHLNINKNRLPTNLGEFAVMKLLKKYTVTANVKKTLNFEFQNFEP